jgi:iron complex outermembrane recepter protein
MKRITDALSRNSLSAAIGIAVASVALVQVPTASAQQMVLEEVIVTAQKREQNLQDVPIAVTAFSGEALKLTGAKDMIDLASNAPSLIVDEVQSSNAPAFGIRGVFTSSQNFGLESSVGLYVDGVYRARQGSMINNMTDIAAVEVLRGPQGTLFGRNTPAGAISIYSVEADHEGTGFLEASYGEHDLLSASGAKSFSAIDDVLAFRATGFIMERDGMFDDVNLGDEKVNDRDRWGARLQALYTPTDDLSVKIIADYSELDEVCCATGIWKNNFVADDVPGKTGTDRRIAELGGTVLRGEDFYDKDVSSSFLPESSNEDKGLSVQIDWHTDNFLLTSITAYRDFEATDWVDADFADIDALTRLNEQSQNSFSQELRISHEYENFNYVAGLYYFQQDLDSESDLKVGDDFTYMIQDLSPFLLLIPGAFPGGTGALNVAEQEHESYAIFGQMDYHLSDAWVLTAGLRWTNEDKDLVNTFTEDASSCNPLECGLIGLTPGWGFWQFPPLAPRDDVDETIDDDQITGTVKLSWFFNDRTMFYASYGTGYKSGGVNVDRIPESLDVVFDAETSASYEIGMKSEFPEQALRVNLALHATDTDDLQTISFQGTGFALANAGVAETYGAELEVFWFPTDTLDVTVGYAYNHGEYADFEEGGCWVGTPWHTGEPDPGDPDPGSGEDNPCDRSGGAISSNPENVLVLTGNQRFSLSDRLSGFVYGEYIYTDSRMTDVNNDPVKEDGSYQLFNLRAGLLYEPWDAELVLWGRNLFDEEYVTTIADKTAQDGNFVAYPTPSTTWGITARKNF